MSPLVTLWILLGAVAVAAVFGRIVRARRDSPQALGFVSREWIEKYIADHL